MQSSSIGRISARTGMLMLVGTIWGCGEGPDSRLTLAARTLASVSASFATADGAQADTAGARGAAARIAAAAPDAAPAALEQHCCDGGRDVYGIVNMVPFQAFGADINSRGQAAFEYAGLDYLSHVGFFDGERVLDPLPQETALSLFHGLNERGELALMVRYLDPASPYSNAYQAARWSVARGTVVLPSTALAYNTYVASLNNHGDIVGATPSLPDASTYQAARWTPANRLLHLSNPAGFGDSSAYAINDSDVSVGDAYAAGSGVVQAIRWDAAGRPTLFGSFGTDGASFRAINNRGDIAGMLDPAGTLDYQAFLWSPGKGLTPIGTRTVLHHLNEAGEVVGRMHARAEDTHAYYFSRTRGLVDLHPRRSYLSEANDIDEHGTIVGLVWRPPYPDAHAWRWSRAGASVDLNTRLLDPPSGLVVTNAFALAANGDIVANSNAGVVVLRHGGGGTDAPVVGPIQLPALSLNQPFQLTLSFRDRNRGDTHSATVDWGDGRGPQPVTVREYRGRGIVRADHTYTAEGDYTIVVRVTDSTGRSSMQIEQRILREFLSPVLRGAGILPEDGPGMAARTAPLLFRLAAPLGSAGRAQGPFAFRLAGRTAFEGERLERASRDGNQVRLEGTGKLNGRSGYRFFVDAAMGTGSAGASGILVRITEAGTARVLFDSSGGAAGGRAAQAARPGVLRNGWLRLDP